MTTRDQPEPHPATPGLTTDFTLAHDGTVTAHTRLARLLTDGVRTIQRGRQHPHDHHRDTVYFGADGQPIPMTEESVVCGLDFGDSATLTEGLFTAPPGTYLAEAVSIPLTVAELRRIQGQIIGEPPPPAPTPGGAQPPDILDRIDAAIYAMAARCAACETVLTANSPSLDYCNEACQATWFERATRPGRPPRMPYIPPSMYLSSVRMPEPPAWWLDPAADGHRITTPSTEESERPGRVQRELARLSATLTDFANSADGLVTAWRGILRLFRKAIATISAHITAAFADIDRTPPGEQEPTDPKERALWLRRHRNTGPKPKRRPPRRIDPTGDR